MLIRVLALCAHAPIPEPTTVTLADPVAPAFQRTTELATLMLELNAVASVDASPPALTSTESDARMLDELRPLTYVSADHTVASPPLRPVRARWL